MEIDSTTVPPPNEYSDIPTGCHTETSMNFDYLHALNQAKTAAATGMDSQSTSFGGHLGNYNVGASGATTTGGLSGMGMPIGAASSSPSVQFDESTVVDRPLNERFVMVLDQLDMRVEKFRKDALCLQEKRDFLLMSIDLIKSNDLMQTMTEAEREEISCYLHRVNSRLSTVELNVRTVRDAHQQDSLSQINVLIDMIITIGDPVISRQRCKEYLNACVSSFPENQGGMDEPVDKKFESALLGCTLDDQKIIKKRLQALMDYLNKQIIQN